MRYAVARYNQYQQETAYRICVSKALRMISENTASVSKGYYMELDYLDFLNGNAHGNDSRTGEQIAADVIKNAGLKVIG